ncbi:MAG: hypothetical protein V1807_01280 [Patescibacteria group bacterium]
MRCRLVLVALFGILLCICQTTEANSYSGVLYHWSQQTVSSDKVILFVHGRRLDIPETGPDRKLLEEIFSFKITNFETIGHDEMFGKSTSEVAEYWLYGYYPQQSPEDIAADLARQICSNSALHGKKIAVVGYSEGGLVCWLLDQRYNLVKGGVLLGAPVLGSPLATKSVRDAAVKSIVGNKVGETLSNSLDQWANGSEWLHNNYAETGQSRSQLMLYAGRIKPCSPAKLAYNILDIIGDIGADFLAGTGFESSNRKFAESLALIISHCKWNQRSKSDQESDGVVPVSSATMGAQTQVWEDYDHYDLITGKLDMTLDRATLKWLDQVLQLSPEFAESEVIPNLPEADNNSLSQINLPTLPEINLTLADLSECRFAYVHQGNLALANNQWSTVKEFDLGQQCEYPRFSPNGDSIVFSSQQTVYRISEGLQATPVTAGRYADWSPNGEWMTYESGAGLCTWRFAKQKQYCIVKDVKLICPPLWVTKGLLGRIYFVAQASDGTTNLYVVSPRARNKDLSRVKKVLANCQGLFLARGLVSGVVAISGQKDKYRMSIVSNWLESNISFEITPADATSGESFTWDNFNFCWSTSRNLSLQSAVLDQADEYALYLELPNEIDHNPGIYLFSLTSKIDNFSLNFDYEVSEVVSNACNLDLNPAHKL